MIREFSFGLMLTGAVIAGAAGCCWKGSSVSATKSAGELIPLPKAKVQFHAPAAWSHVNNGDWTIFKPSDNAARLGVVVFDKPGEATRRITEVAGQFGMSDVVWNRPHIENIGPNALPARVADGTCKLGVDPCYVWYATVNPGTNEQVLIVYAVNTKLGTFHKANAQAAIESLRKM